jgi:hypothetical protein
MADEYTPITHPIRNMDGVKALAALHNAGELTAEVGRLQAENRRLTDRNRNLERMLLEWKEIGGPPSRHRNRAAKFEAVIDQVRAHCEKAKDDALQLRAETGESYYTDDVDPDDILALLPPAPTPGSKT